MKTLKTAIAAITAALLAMALLASPSSAALGTPDGADVGNLYQDVSASNHTHISPPFDEGQQIGLAANFADGVRTVTIYRDTGGGWQNIASKQSNSSGNAYFTYTVLSGNQKLFAEATGDLETEVDEFAGTPTPQSTTAVLDAPTNGGKTWTAHFGSPAVPGKATELQIQRIYTDEVGDVDAVNPTAKKTEKMGEWKTIATSTQNATGDSTFNVPSPYPYRVAHKYRAVSGTAKSCEPVNAKSTGCQTFGLPQRTPEDTGLSAVYFNTNEGQAVDTRTRYFEGEFEMTAGSPGCSAVAPMKFTTMKGRGNYSWSFKRKSYTLKLGDSTDLCGMGKSKKYALVSQDYDKSFMRNALAQYIGSKFTNMAWTPESKPVDFYLNGKYLGNYMLVERIAIAADRVNIPELKGGESATSQGACQGAATPENQTTDPNHPNNIDPCKTGGYILEWDFRKGGDYNAYLGSDSGYVGVKDPEHDYDREGVKTTKGISSQQQTYINNYLNKVDGVLRGSNFRDNETGWKKYINKESAVDYYIAMEYMKPVDGNMWASVYMYKQRDSAAGAEDGQLYFGPMWDFDLGAGSATRAGNVVSPSGFYLRNFIQHSAQQDTTNGKTWFNRLNEDPEFRNAVAARWDAVQASLTPGSFIDGLKATIKDSAETSFSLAPNGASHSYRISQYQVIKSNFDADVAYLRKWANDRKSWLNGSSGF
jgi:hypothetical protein